MKSHKDLPILVVDDEESILNIISQLLQSHGFEVIEARNGKEALTKLKNESFSVIFSDQKMPVITGIDLLKKSKELNPNTVRVLLSGYADLDMAKEAIAQGEVYRFLSKPFNLDELLLCVRDALDHHRLLLENQRLLEELKAWNERLGIEVQVRTREIQESEEKYRNLFEKAHEGIVLIDNKKGYTIFDCNQAFEDMTGYGRSELIGRSFWEIQDKGRYSLGLKTFIQQLQRGINNSIHLYFLRKNGEAIIINLLASEVEIGGSLIIQGFCIDITERIKLEEELREANRVIQEKSDEMEEFLYITSHEVQTPLVPIFGYAKLLVECYEDKLDSKAINWLEEIRNSSLILKRLVKDLLDLSSLKTQIRPFKMINVEDLISEVIQSHKGFLLEKDIKTKIIGKLPPIYGDPVRVRVVFNNLINNAIKHMNETAERQIVVAYRELDLCHEFSIIDKGPGISEEDCKNVFKPMWRHPERKSEGSGLGLYFVKRIMEIHGGDIWVESELGKGSRFCLSFPKSSAFDIEDKRATAQA
jgi:PAS domain S-box-containing protein